jgi:hypothetical protein
MWFLVVFAVAWLGILIYEFSTGRLLPGFRRPFFGKEVQPDSELFWGIYALHVFGFLFFVAMLVWMFYFKGR